MEIATGVYGLRLEGTQGGRELVFHPSAVETPTRLLLVDTGLPGQEAALREALDEEGLALADVTGVLLTHQDPDHAGGLSAVVSAVEDEAGRRPTVYAHPDAAPFVDGRRQPIKMDDDRYPAVTVDVEVTDGTRFATEAGPMTVLATPGHTPGHLSAYFPDEQTLLAGDALTADEDLAGPSEAMTLDLAEATRSIRTLAGLRIRQVLAYHGGHVETTPDRIEAVYDELAASYDVA